MALSVFAGVANAWDFAFGVNIDVPALVVVGGGALAGGTYSVTVALGPIITTDGRLAQVLSTHIPIQIGEGAAAETVTPSAVAYINDPLYGPCATITATYANAHGQGARVSTGDYGIGEAQLYVTGKWGGGLVSVSPALVQASGTAYNAVPAFIHTIVSASATATVLDWSGNTGATSYTAAVGSDLTATAHVLY